MFYLILLHNNSNPDVNDPLYENTSSLIPSLPTTPIPKRIQKKLATGKTLRNHAIDDLPLQHVSSNRRMEDLDDEEYGYTTNAIIKKRKEKEICLEDTFMDAGNLDPYKEDSHNPMINRFFFGERLPGDNLQRRLLKAREKGKIIPIVDLIKIIIQAVKAVIYVHNQGCLLRDITTASYGCMVSDDGYFLKLKNFEMAVRPSNFSEDGIVNGVIDLDFKGVPIRWAAPESLLKGHYSIYSDVWSLTIGAKLYPAELSSNKDVLSV
uniref:Tyrosine-protein kinase transforming protein Fps n=1 Tax=Magallana gigas TaxID=29159 RepID=K1RC80_MAGGI